MILSKRNMSAHKVSSGIRSSVKIIIASLIITIGAEIFFLYNLSLTFDNQFWQWKKEELIRITDTAVSSFDRELSDFKAGKTSKPQTLQSIISAINKLSYRDDSGTNYFFLFSSDGTILAHPYEKQLIGKSFSKLSAADENNFMQQLLSAAAEADGKGFAYYAFTYPNSKDTGQKISYVHKIDGLDAFIGTGLYAVNTKQQAQKLLNIIGSSSLIIVFLVFAVIFFVLYHLKNILSRLKVSNNRFTAVYNGIGHFIGILDSKYRIIDANKPSLEFIGKTIDDIGGMPFRETPWWTDEETSRPILDDAIKAFERGEHKRYEVTCIDCSGVKHIFSFSMYPAADTKGSNKLIIVESMDITSIKKKETEIYQLAYYDRISSLPNEKLMEWTFEQMKTENEWEKCVLALIEAGNLSLINNLLGLEAGNAMVRALAKRIENQFSFDGTIILGRVAGSVFTICVPYHQRELLFAGLEKLKTSAEEPILFSGYSAHVIMYIGIAEFPEHGTTFSELLKNAAAAKDESKFIPGRTFNLFDNSITDRMSTSLFLQESLRSPNLSNELEVHFQPQYSIESKRVEGYEALVRWNHPERGLIPPSTFIPIAESEGMISKIGNFVTSEVCRFISTMGKDSLCKISINVSVVQLLDRNFMDSLSGLLLKWNVSPEMVPLEITETVLIESFDAVLPVLEELSRRGHEIHLDDFGSGFSSLTYFSKLPIQVLKLDKSFIDQMSDNKKTQDLVKAIIQIAHSQNLRVIAEGVEVQSDADLLETFKCDILQGWLTGRPLTFDSAILHASNIN